MIDSKESYKFDLGVKGSTLYKAPWRFIGVKALKLFHNSAADEIQPMTTSRLL